MRVNWFFKDVMGASRVTNARRKLIASGDPTRPYADHPGALAAELHPAWTRVRVAEVRDASPTARFLTFVPVDGDVLPPFQAGQYVSFELKVGPTKTTRPYSICSAPWQARQGTDSFFEICVRNGKPGVSFAANWLYGLVKVGDEFVAHLPYGQFFYEPLRDARHVGALAGGSGITPFLSMAREIAHGALDCDLTILYGSASASDIIARKELEAVCGERVHLVNVLSGDDETWDGERGFLSADLIKKYSPADPASGAVSYFVCGPQAMYEFVRGELDKLGVPVRRVRMEVFGAPRDITKAAGYPGASARMFSLTVRRGLREDRFMARANEPLLVALERAGVLVDSRCRSGACGACRVRLVEGEVFVPETGDGRRWADKKFGYVHSCSTWPLSDCTIEVIIK